MTDAVHQVKFSEEELAILRPRRPLSLLEWAERNRRLSEKTSFSPGPWRVSRTPYMRGPHEAFSDSAVQQITLLTSTQVAKTTFVENVLAYTFDQRPRPTLMVMPRDKDADDFSKDRLQPLFKCCPSLRGLGDSLVGSRGNRTADITKRVYRLPRMNLRFATSNSPAALSSWPCGVICMDEVSKYKVARSGKATDPVALAIERTRTFPDRKIVVTSTPEADGDLIMIEFENSDARYFHVPCPHCGVYQVLEWEQLKYTDNIEERKRLVQEREGAAELAWYECAHCGERIDDVHKSEMLRKGVWARRVQVDEKTLKDAEVPPDFKGTSLEPWTRHTGFFLWAAYSPWLTFAEIAAQYLESKGNLHKYSIFVTLWLARPWQEEGEAIAASVVTACIDNELAAFTVPEWAVVLTAMFDLHKRHIPFVIRAWGPDVSSSLVWHGVLPRPGGVGSPLDEVIDPVRSRLYDGHAIALLGIDARWDTEQVYIYAAKHPRQVCAVMGANSSAAPPIVPRTIQRLPGGKPDPRGGVLYHINPGYWTRTLYDHMAAPKGAPGEWRCYGDVAEDPVYLEEVANQHGVKSMVRGRAVVTWGPKNAKKGDHFHDCEKGALALARSNKIALLRRTKKAPDKSFEERRVRKGNMREGMPR
jgi:phage terminase large subunit GpA-like protein